MKRLVGAVLGLVLLPAAAWAAQAPQGETVYRTHCASCHDGGAPRAPKRDALQAFQPERVVKALIDGPMGAIGRGMNAAEMEAVATFLTGKKFTAAPMPETAWCSARVAELDGAEGAPAWNGWGNDIGNRRFQPAERAGLTAADVPRLKLKWAFAIPGVIRAYGQPTIVGGTAFIGTAADKVYALDARTGCVRWSFDAEAGVRGAIVVGQVAGRWMAFFGDLRGQAYGVDARTGQPLWKRRIEDHPAAYITGGMTLYEDRIYAGVASREETAATPTYDCCTFRGSVQALDAATGAPIWKTFTIPDEPRPTVDDGSGSGRVLKGPSGAGVWSAPTVDPIRRAVYVGTGNAYTAPEPLTSNAIMAFDMDTGRVRWSRQMSRNDIVYGPCATPLEPWKCDIGPDYDFGSSPVLSSLPDGRRILMAGQKSAVVHGLDPDQDGRILWQTRIGEGGNEGGIEFGMATDGRLVYAPLSDLKFMHAEPGQEGANATIVGISMTLDAKRGGGVFALDPATGKVVWRAPPVDCTGRTACSPAQTAAASVIPGVVFAGSVSGHLRAHSTRDGRVLWQVDTMRPYETVNGVEGKGGSIDGPGPVIVGGMVYTNSGYGYIGGTPGNVLLAFSVDGK